MPSRGMRIQLGSIISCCRYCVPPKRHSACWGHCPEYLKEKAEYEAIKAERSKQAKIEADLYAQRAAAVKRVQKRR